MSGVHAFLQKNSQIFEVVASVSTVLALLFTGYQIYEARRGLEASTVYQLQRDGREILKSHDVAVRAYVFGVGARDPTLAARGEPLITEMIQYYSSVLNQRRNGVIGDSYWDAFDREMCTNISRSRVKEFWTQKVAKGLYSDDFKRWGEDCLNREIGYRPGP